MTTAYSESKQLVLDSVKCKKGKPCGDICIPVKKKCNINQAAVSGATGGAIGLGVGGALGTAAAIAGVSALSVSELKEVRKKYIANFATSAIKATAESKNIKSPIIDKDVNTVIMAVGGWGTKDAYSESEVLKQNIESLGIKGLYIEPQSYADFNVPTRPTDAATRKQAGKEASSLFFKTAVKQKHNPVALKLAAKVIAYKRDYPDKDFQLIGHSGGGLIAQETHEILNKANIKVRTTAIGSPNIGLIPGTGDLVTASSKNDKILKLFGGGTVNARPFNDVPDHAQNEYFKDKDFNKFIKDRITSTRKDRFDKAICKVGKNCGDVCIPKTSKCNAEKSLAPRDRAIVSALKSPTAAIAGSSVMLLAGLAATGLPIGVMLSARERYRNNLPKSIKMAQEKASKIDPARLKDFSDKDQITFFQSGFTAGGGKVREAAYVKGAGDLLKRQFPNHGVIERFNHGFNITPIIPDPDPRLSPSDPGFYPPITPQYLTKFLGKAVSKTVGTFFVTGHNPEAVNLASEVYAYHQKHPTKPLNIIGHSAGGLVAPEAANILKGMGVKSPVKVVSIGAPDFGVIDYPGMRSYASKKDPITGYFPNKKAKFENDVKTHSYESYLLNPKIEKDISEYFNGEKKTDSVNTKSKKCGKGHIPIKYRCRIGLKQPESGKFVKNAVRNTGTTGAIAAGAGLTALGGAAVVGGVYHHLAFRPPTIDGEKTAEVFDKKPLKDKVINNIPLTSVDPNFYKNTPDNTDFKEPDFPIGTKNKKVGVIIAEPDGRTWIYEPTNHYAGTKNTFSKGTVEEGLSYQQNALKEAHEELGLQVKIVDHLGDFGHSSGKQYKEASKDGTEPINRYYVAVRKGGTPADAGWEADKVKLVGPDVAAKLFNVGRDKKVLKAYDDYAASEANREKLISNYQESEAKAATRAAWKPAMSTEEANRWTADSAYKKTLYHATSAGGSEGIQVSGFRKDIRSVGKAYGRGVYLGLSGQDVEPYRKLQQKMTGSGTTLEIKANVNKVLDLNKIISEGNPGFLHPSRNNAIKQYEHVAKKINLHDSYLTTLSKVKKESSELKRDLKSKKITKEQYESKIADFPESEAFSQIVQRAGYDAIKLKGGRAKINMLVVFDPKNLTVVKKPSARADAIVPAIDTSQIKKQLAILLSRSYGKAIAKIGGLKISLDNTVTGMAQDSLGKILNFTFKDDKLTYELSKKSAKMDSADLWIGLITNYREDKGFVKKKCGKGIACGDTCISASDTCRLKINQVASPSEISRLKQSIVRFKLEQNQAPVPQTQNVQPVPVVVVEPIKSKYVVNPKTGQNYTIRELRKTASEKRIYGYGSMTIKELQTSLQLYDEKPESRERITSGITRRKGFSTRAIAASGLSGRGTPSERTAKRSLKNTADTWRKLEALAKFAGSSPVAWSAAAVGAFLFGATVRSYENSKQLYREGFNESARIAEERAAKLNIQHPVERNGEPVLLPSGKPRMSSRIMQDNITFTVGGGKGYGAEKMKAALQKEKDPTNKKDYWFTQSNYVIPFNLQEFGTPKERGEKDPSAASTVVNGFGGIIQNFSRRRNQDAVDLAAQIYAHGIAVSQTDGRTRVNRDKKINILAHSSGGLVTKEALEILSRMQLKGSPSGKKILEQVNAVYLGTPHFGFAENVSRRQRTIVSPQDPVSFLPTFGEGSRQQWISSVKGGSSTQYLEDERVRDAIRESFGYYQGSPDEVSRRFSKRGDAIRQDKESKCSPQSKNCGEVCIPKSSTCHKGQGGGTLGQSNPVRSLAIGGLAGAGIVTTAGGGLAIAGAYLGIKANVPLLKDNQLSLVNQDYLNQLKPDGKPQQGASGKTSFVRDEKNNRLVFKEILNPFKLLESAAEATTSDMAQKSGISINKVSLVSARLRSPIKTGFAGASLHSFATGKTLTEENETNPNSAFKDLNIKQEKGFSQNMLLAISKHPDLSKMAAFDTFTGNWDRKSDNLFYDNKSNRFTGVDNGLAYTKNLAAKSLKNLKDLDTTKLSEPEKKALISYTSTLKELHQQHNYKTTQSRYASYVAHENGDWNLVKRYSIINNIEKNHKDTGKLIQLLESKVGKTKLDSSLEHLFDTAYSLEKELVRLDFAKRCKTGVPCGDICLPMGRKCRLRESKFDPRKLSAKLGRGAVSQSVGGIGQDLERVYLRTSRLIKSKQNKIPQTNLEKFKDAAIHEAKLVGVLLGQGTISKTIKSVDQKLIDFSDFVSETPEKIAQVIESVKKQLSKIVVRKPPQNA